MLDTQTRPSDPPALRARVRLVGRRGDPRLFRGTCAPPAGVVYTTGKKAIPLRNPRRLGRVGVMAYRINVIHRVRQRWRKHGDMLIPAATEFDVALGTGMLIRDRVDARCSKALEGGNIPASPALPRCWIWWGLLRGSATGKEGFFQCRYQEE